MIPILLWSCGESPTPVNKVEQRTVTSTPVGKVERQWDKFALVIGNSAYQSVNPLKSPAKDAQDMAETLKNIGFGQVTTLLNGSKKAMDDAITAVAKQAKGQSVVVYYSGHGVQLEEENYLVPVDAPDPQTAAQAKKRCVSVNDVLSELHESGCSPKIVILDACRNNPFKGLGGGKAVGGKGGLAKPASKFTETYLAFATNPGEVAPDGNSSNENSPYTQVLLAELRKPNVQIEQTFKSVRAKLQDSGQTPWENTSLAGEFVFFPQKTVAPAPIVVAPPVVITEPIAPPVPADPAEIAFKELQKSQKLADWKHFVATYPKSTYLNTANIKIAALEQELKRALNDANLMKQDLPEAAKTELLKAKNIAPEHTEVIALDQFLNKK
jgi:Caspase domain